MIITGHRNGVIIVWEKFDFSYEVKGIQGDIVAIASFKHGVMIGTTLGKLHFWDFHMK